MKTIGLIGGMSWESTVTYYKVINETVSRELGGLHSAEIILHSVDFDVIEKFQSRGEWDKCAEVMSDSAVRLEKAGADFIVICTNTLHKVVPQINADIPILHIADAAAEKIKAKKITSVGLLGTKYTMTEPFYREKLKSAGIDAIVPDDDDIGIVNAVIFDELCIGKVKSESREVLLRIIKKLEAKGAEGIILGCTELGLIVGEEDTSLPLFDTSLIHAEKAALLALGKE